MVILIIADEAWNDELHVNNVLSNWFSDFDAQFAEIYCSPGLPVNNICKIYFHLTDMMMLKSFLSGKKAGEIIKYSNYPSTKHNVISNSDRINIRLNLFLKKISGPFLRFIREMIWCIGKYDSDKLYCFLNDVKPDIIFCPRYSSLKLLRLEKFVRELSQKPVIAFTGDDEFSLKHISFSPFFWIDRVMVRQKMKKEIPNYSLYYMHSPEQAQIYSKEFRIPTKLLYKCGIFQSSKIHSSVNEVIVIAYIGRLYCNRWKTLVLLSKKIKKINQNGKKIILNIYTQEILTKKQNKLLNDNENVFFKGMASYSDLQNIYDKSDVLLHVESFDKKNALTTRYSFSTKIIDCLSSGCAVMAICPDNQTGFKYLRERDAAFTACNDKELEVILNNIVADHSLIISYAKKAYICGEQNHSKEIVQANLITDFSKIIK